MFNGFVRFFIFVTTLFVAWLATGRLLAATHPPDWWWLGYVQATGVELVLGYCVWLIARTMEKGIIGLMIVFFGLFSISAQVLHAHFFGVPLPNEDNLPWALAVAWKYVLPSIPTLAGVSVGLLELADKHSSRPSSTKSHTPSARAASPKTRGQAYAMTIKPIEMQRKNFKPPRKRTTRRRKKI